MALKPMGLIHACGDILMRLCAIPSLTRFHVLGHVFSSASWFNSLFDSLSVNAYLSYLSR